MTRRDLRNASIDEKKEAMKSALFVDAIETLLANKTRDTLQPGEAHIVIETEATDDGLNIMLSCVSLLSPTEKVCIVSNLMRSLEFSQVEAILLLVMVKDFIEQNQSEDTLGGLFGHSPLSQ